MTSIKVVIADKQALTKVGLKSLVDNRKDFQLLGDVDCLEDLRRILKIDQPQVLLVDYNLADFISISNLQEVKTLSPDTKILIISSDNEKSNIFEVIQVGISGFVTKECSQQEIVGAIYAAAKGEKFFCNKVLDLILENHLKKEPEDDCLPTELSVREVEIVRLTAGGMNARQIAEKLHLSHHTVYTHRKNVMKKLSLGSASELTLYAVKTGIINT